MDHSKISSNHFKQYQNLLIQMGVSESTIKRKLASLRKFSGWLAHEGYLKENPFQEVGRWKWETGKRSGTWDKRKISFPISKSRFKPLTSHLSFKAHRALPYFTYLNFLILVVFLTALGWGLYQQFVVRAPSPLAYPEEGVGPKRYLSFQGRLTDSNYTPIVTAVNMEFKLYDAAGTGTGTLLWESGVCSVDPDQDGIFALLLGTPSGEGYTCSSALEIPSHVFSENAEVWLETKVASETLSPRIQIATVAYALNAETLQGFPLASAGSTTPEATMGATARTVPAINPAGNLVIASDSPTIWSTSGTFGIKGQAISIQTDTGTGGNITLAPDGIGVLNIVPTSGNQIGGTINATNSALTTGALYTGRVENENTGFDFLRFFGGTTPTEKFSVGALGSIDMENNLDVGGAATITGTLKVDGSLISNLIPSGTRNLGSSGSNWDYLYINNLDAFTLQGAVTGNGQSINDLATLQANTLEDNDDTTLSVNDNLSVIGNVVPSAGNTYDLGSPSLYWNNLYANNIYGGTGGTQGYWTKATGLIYPNNAYESVAIGGTATTSAKLYFEGTTGNASMSGNLTLTGGGTIGATDMNNLTLGDSSTQNVIINPNSYVGIGTTAPAAKLEVVGRIYQSGLGLSTFVGYEAGLNDDLTNNYNAAFGYQALYTNTSGIANTAVGYRALNSNTTGGTNSAFGYSALFSNTTGVHNDAFGTSTLKNNTTGSWNVGLGDSALYYNTTGSDNIAIGDDAMRNNTTGYYNTVVGDAALYNTKPTSKAITAFADSGTDPGVKTTVTSATHGQSNGTVVQISGTTNYNGSWTISNVATDTFDITKVFVADDATGWWAIDSEGRYNTALGFNAGYSNVTGSANVFLGYQAGYSETGSNKLYIENSNSSTPLIWGDFSTDTLGINGDVGIGTTAPTAELDVSGTASVSALTIRGTSPGYINQINGNDLQFRTSAGGDAVLTPRLTITNAGNVGIGTTNPSQKLEVASGNILLSDTSNGSLKLSYGGQLFDESSRTLIEANNDSFDVITENGSGHMFEVRSTAYNFYLSNVVKVNIDSSGNLAIEGALSDLSGTTLSINDNLSVVGNVLPSAGSTYDLGSTTAYWNNLYVNNLFGGTGGTQGHWSKSNGLIYPNNTYESVAVGGTATTSAKLYFEGTTGNASMSGNLTLTGGGTIGATDMNNLTIGDANTNNVQFYSGSYYLNPSGQLTLATNETINGIDISSGAILDLTGLTFDGSARTITNANQLTLSTSGASSDLVLSAGRDITFDDDNLSSPVPLSLADSALNASLAQGIIDAINDAYEAAVGSGGISGFWTKTSGLLFPNNTYESVAIGGTSTASAKLYFEGTTGSASMSGQLTLHASGTNYINTLSGQALSLRTSTGGDAGLTDRLYISNAGNVGIGTTSPNNLLHVLSSGDLDVEFETTATGANYAGLMLTSPEGSWGIYTPSTGHPSLAGDFGIYDWGTTTYRFVIMDNGNVGIGTTSPGAKLDVAGNATISGTLALGPQTRAYAGNCDAAAEGKMYYDASADKYYYCDGGTWTEMGAGAAELWEAGTYGTFEDDAAVIVGADADFTHGIAEGVGDLRVASDMEVLGNTYFGGASNYLNISSGGDLSLYGTADTIDVSNVTGTKLIISGGYVGIGTSTPTALLDVAGDASTSGSLVFRGTSPATIDILNGDDLRFQTSVGGDTVLSPRMTLTNAGNVGIGTTNPSAKLHVEGQCVTGDSVLPIARMENGKWKMENDNSKFKIEYKQIKDIKGGEYVLSLNEQTGKIVPAKIKGLLDMGIQPVYRLTTEDGRTIRTTGNHPYLVRGLLAPQAEENKIAGNSNRDESGNDQINISLHNSFPPFVDEIKNNQSQTTNNSREKIGISHVPFNHDLTSSANFKETTKNIPAIAIETTKVNSNPLREVGRAKSGEIAPAENQATAMFPAISEARSSWPTENFSIFIENNYNIVNSQNVKPFDKLRADGEQSQIIKWTKVIYLKTGMEIAVQNGETVAWKKIKSIEELPAEQVYDIEVEGTHNFVANGIIAHNTYLGGNTTLEGNLLPSSGDTYDLGSSTAYWNNLYANNIYGTSTGTQGFWTKTTGLIYPNNTYESVAIGGTSTTSAKLYFEGTTGNASMSGNLTLFGTSPAINTTNMRNLTIGGASTGNIQLAAGSATPAFVLTTAGNVGIGTTSPGAKLDVAGNATISGTLALGPQTRAYAGNCDASAEGKMYYDASADKYYYCDGSTWTEMGAGAAELWEAGTYGTYEDDAAVIVGADAAFSWADGGVGDLKVADQLEVVGDASISGTLTIGQGETIRPAYGPLQFAYKSGADAWTTGMVMTEQGNVGIGTTNPTSMLTLASSAPTFRMIDTTGSAKSLLLTVDGNLAVFKEAGGAADDLLVLDLANGRVGIGTTAPLTKLHVDGTTTGKALAIFNETGTNDILTASASGTTRLTLESSGNMTINREATESAYTETLSTNAFSGGGVAQSWNADDNYWEYDLPFDFPFFENIYNKIYISSNGEIYFSDPSKYALYYHTDFLGAKAIAPLWGNWTTAGNGQANEDIYITSSSTQLKIYWKGEIDGYPTDILNFEAILYKNGRIQFNYGSGNTNLQTLKSQHGKIGVSNGDYRHFYESSRSLQSSQTNSQTITFTPAWPVFDIQNKGETVFQANAEKATIAGDFSLGKTTMEPLTRTFTEETPEDRVLALVEDENFVYAGIGSDPPKVMRIDKRDHSTYTVKSLGIDDGWIRSLALDSQYLYAGTSTGKVIRINLSDFNTTTTKTFSESTSAIYGLAVDSTETYLYVGLNTSPGKILKIPINDFTGSYSVKTFNSGDNKVYSLIIDSSDTYLYAGLYLDPGRVVKLTLSDFSTTTTKTFASGEKYIRSLALDSSYLYAGCETSQSATGKIIRVLLSDFNTTTTKTLLTYQQVSSLAIDSSKTYLYAGLNKYPGQILKITIADFTGSHVTKTLSSDEDKVYALAIDSTYIYAGCWTFPGIVSKIPLGDFTGSSWDVLVFAQPMSFGSYRSEFVIDSTETYLYAVGGGYKGKIYRFDLDDFHNYTVKILDEGDNYPIGLAIDSTYLYASLGGYPSKIIRIKLADFTGPYDTKTLASGEDWAYDIVVDSTYLYAGCSTTPGKIVRLTLADFSTTSTKNLTNNNVYSLAIDSSSTYLYAGMDEYPGIIERLTLSDFNTTSTKTLTKNSAPHMAIDSNDTYLYIGHWDNAVTRLTLSDFNTTAVNNLPVDIYDYALDVAIDPDETYLYAGLSSWPGWVARINLANFTATADLYPTPCDDDDWTRCPAYLSVIAVDSKYVYAGSEYASPEGGIVRFALEARYISSQNYDLAIKTGNQNDEAQIYLDTNGNIFFGTAKSEIIRLLSDNVEIDAYETAIQGNLKVQGSSLFSGPAGFKFLQADELTIGTASARLTDYGAGLNITTKFLPGNDVASNSALTIDTDATLSSANLFSIKNNGTTKVVVDSSGNVGIGTTNPGAKLEVMSGSTTYNGEIGSFKITYNSDPTEQLYFGWDNSLGTYGSAYLQSVKSGTTYTPLLLNPAGGNVGITTNTPDAALDVGSGALKAGNGYAVGTRRGSNYRLDYSSCTMTNAVCGTCSWGVTFSSTPTAVCSTSGGATTQHDVGVSSSTTAATVCANDHSGTWSHTVVCIGFGPTTMTDFDLAESFKTNDQAIEPGEVVCIDPENNSHIVKCTKPYDATAIGIVSTEPGLIIGDELTPDSRLVGLQGRVPVKVTLENGPIERGDPLTPSATKPGFAMKAIKGGQIIGKAIQPFNGNSTVLGENAFDGISEDKIKEIISKTQATGEGQTMAFINVSWYDPDVYLTSAGELNIQMSPNENNPNESEYSLTDASGKIIERVGAFAEAAIAELQAGLIQTQELIADSLIVNQKLVSPVVETDQLTADSIQSTESKFGKLLIENEEGKTVASIDNAGNASFGGMLEASAVTSDQLSVTGDATVAGTLYAGEIVTKKGTFGDLLARVENLESSLTVTPTLEPTPTPSDTSEVSPTPSAVPSTSEVEAETAEATDSGLLADSESWPISDPSNDVQITDSLTVLGTSSLADTSVAGQLMVDATVIIDKDGIQTLPGSTLKLQAYGWGGIDMLDGKVTIDTQGNVLITGELTAGRIKTGGLILSEAVKESPLQKGDSLSSEESGFGKLLSVLNKEGLEVASIDASGSAFFAQLGIEADYSATQSGAIIAAFDNYYENGYLAPAIKTNATAGIGILPANEEEVMIYNPQVTGESLIYVTATTNTENKVLYVKAKHANTRECQANESECANDGYFIVALNESLTKDIQFNWWIIGAKPQNANER